MGTGVVVGNMDTGVDGNHPALASRWRGLYAPVLTRRYGYVRVILGSMLLLAAATALFADGVSTRCYKTQDLLRAGELSLEGVKVPADDVLGEVDAQLLDEFPAGSVDGPLTLVDHALRDRPGAG